MRAWFLFRRISVWPSASGLLRSDEGDVGAGVVLLEGANRVLLWCPGMQVPPRKLAGDGKSQSDGWINICAANLTERADDRNENQPDANATATNYTAALIG